MKRAIQIPAVLTLFMAALVLLAPRAAVADPAQNSQTAANAAADGNAEAAVNAVAPAAPAGNAAAPTAPAPAAPAPPAAPAAPAFDAAAVQQILTKLQNQLPTTTNDQRLAAMDAQASVIAAGVDRELARRQAALAEVDAALGRYPLRRRASDQQVAWRAPLLGAQAALTEEIRRLQVLDQQVDQTYQRIAERRREGFSQRVLERTPPPISPQFWTSIADAAGTDLARLWSLLRLIASTMVHAPEPRGIVGLAAGLIVGLLLVFPIRRLLDRLGQRTGEAVSGGQAARTLAAVWRVLVEVAAPTLAAAAVRFGAQWGGLLAPVADQLASALVGSIAWGAAVIALGRALVAADRPQDRLLNLQDPAAVAAARMALWSVALVTGVGFFLQKVNYVVGASVAATIAANCLVSLAYAVTAALILVSFGRRGGGDDPADKARSPAWTLISLTLAAAVVATVGAVLAGYSTLAALISGQIFWLSMLAAATYLLLRLIDDVLGALFQRRGKAAVALQRLFGLRASTIAQVGLLVSAALQLVLIVAAFTLAITPFGLSGELLVSHIRSLGSDIQIGKATISPLGVVGGLMTFIIGLALSHLAKLWVTRRYLPATDWDAGVRNSVSTGVAYLGVAIAIACALAVTGLGLQQIALVASALSVGIGFGLQQIVQNFVAGVILLIERPVQVGDWVSVSGVEGDVVNIRVRATEIRTFDCSTVIVPNSSLITTNVQNKTWGQSRSRVQLQVSVAKSGDVAKAREALVALASQRPEVLHEPAPNVVIDGLAAGGGANLIVSLYVDDPRHATRVRSDLYAAVLEEFPKKDIALL